MTIRQAFMLIWLYLKLSIRSRTLLYLFTCLIFLLSIPIAILWIKGILGIITQMILTLLPETVHLIFSSVFWFWLLLPFFVKVRYASAEGYHHLYLYPLDFRRFYALNLVAGVMDLPVLIMLPILAVVPIGLGLAAHLSTLVLSLIVIVSFVFISFLFIQLVGFLLKMAFASRRWLRILYGCAFVSLIALSFLPAMLNVRNLAIRPGRLDLSLYPPVLPYTLAANALMHLHEGDISYVFRISLPFMGAYLVALGYLAYRLALKIYLGGVQARSKCIDLRRASLFERVEKVIEKLCFFLPAESRAFLAKDMVYLMRWNTLKVSYILLLVISLVVPWSHSNDPFSCIYWRMWLVMLYPITFSLNMFGIDGAAVRHYFVAPISSRNIVIVKSCTGLVHAGISLIIFAVALLIDRGYRPDYLQYLSLIAFSIGGILVLNMLGGRASILHPMTIQIREVWGRTSNLTLYAIIVYIIAVTYMSVATALCLGKDQNVVLASAWGFVMVVSVFYVRFHSNMAKFLENHKEQLLMSLRE